MSVAAAIVTRNDDPDGLGRVKLNLPWRQDGFETDWVRVVAPMAGPGRGTFFLPEVGDEVLLAFDGEDLGFPYVLGALWSKTHAPPDTNADGKNNIRMIRTRKGHILKFDDDTRGSIMIQLAGGEKQIRIDDDGILIDDGSNKVTLDAKGGSITIEATASLSLKAPDIRIEASKSLELRGGGSLVAKADLVRIN